MTSSNVQLLKARCSNFLVVAAVLTPLVTQVGCGGEGDGADGPGTGATSTASSPNPSNTNSMSSSGAEARYNALGCATCHGSVGQGVAGLGPELQHPEPEHMRWVVRNGGSWTTSNGMSPRLTQYMNSVMLAYDTNTLSDADLDAIIAWLDEPPHPTSGAELFADFCANCHGADGRGGGMAVNGFVDAYATSFHSAPFCRQGAGDEAGFTAFVNAGSTAEPPSERRKYMPAFAGVLTAGEISAIWDWTPKGTNMNANGNCTTQ